MAARVYDFAAFRDARDKRVHGRQLAAAIIDLVHRAGFELVPRVEVTEGLLDREERDDD